MNLRVPLYAAIALTMTQLSAYSRDAGAIAPWPDTPGYWQYDGRPVLLLGGSKTDHIFLLDDLDAHLTEMANAGANYARCVMSQREEPELKPHLRLEDGRFDLRQWNPEYWRRFDACLRRCAELGIILQIELWDRFDYSQEQWLESAWRPANNVNYAAEESGLANAYPAPAWRDRQPFFHTLPGSPLHGPGLQRVLKHQTRFVAKVLEHSLPFGNVLYCIGNESSAPLAWTLHWAERLREQAQIQGSVIHITAMLAGGRLEPVLDRPTVFGFVDASKLLGPRRQDWAPRGMEQFSAIAGVCERASQQGRPTAAVKIICNVDDEVDAYSVRKFWRGLMAGLGAVRFHRPPAGSGLNEAAQNAIRAARAVDDRLPFRTAAIRQELLIGSQPDEAYLRAAPGRGYIAYLPRGGQLSLDLGVETAPLDGIWIDITQPGETIAFVAQNGEHVTLQTPSPGPWAALLLPRRD